METHPVSITAPGPERQAAAARLPHGAQPEDPLPAAGPYWALTMVLTVDVTPGATSTTTM